MKKIFMFMLVSLMLVSLVNAQNVTSQIKESVEPLEGMEIPGPMGTLYSNEVFNIYVDGEIVGHAVIEDKVFVGFKEGEGKATMNIYAGNKEVVKEVMTAGNGLDKFNELRNEGKIRVEPIGFGKKFKWGLTSIATRMMGWFM